MSVPSANEDGPVDRLAFWHERPIAALTLAFAVPLPLILVSRVLFSPAGPAFSFGVYFACSTFEFVICLALDFLLRRRRIGRRLHHNLSYLIHTTLGLPATIYLAAAVRPELIGFLRMLCILWRVLAFRRPAQSGWHIALVFVGLPAYTFLGGQTPDARQLSGLLVFGAGMFCLAWLHRIVIQNRLQASKNRRRVRHLKLQAERDHLRESAALRPYLFASEMERWRRTGELDPLYGIWQLARIALEDVATVLEDFLNNMKDGLEAFHRELSQLEALVHREAAGAGLIVLPSEGGWWLGRCLRTPMAPPDIAVERDAAVQLLQALWNLARYSRSSRRALLRRGRRGIRLDMRAGQGLALRLSGASIASARPVGPLRDALMAPPPGSERIGDDDEIWLREPLSELLGPLLVEEHTLSTPVRWVAVRALRPELLDGADRRILHADFCSRGLAILGATPPGLFRSS